MSLLQQQFWDPPDHITDRTRARRLKVAGSAKVIENLSHTLLKGTEGLTSQISSYQQYCGDIAKKLGLDEQTVLDIFEEKTKDRRSVEDQRDETILLVFAVGAILSAIRTAKQDDLLSTIRDLVRERSGRQWTVHDEVKLTEQVDYLFQTSDSELSLLLNLGVLSEIANCLNLGVNSGYFEKYFQKITQRLTEQFLPE